MKTRRVLLAGAVALVAVRIRQRGWRLVEHDLVDHPLMSLWPKVGDWLHDRDELLEDEGGSLLLFQDGPACIVCGCTDRRACEGGCSWAQVDPPVCSRCEARSRVVELTRAGGFANLAAEYMAQAHVQARTQLGERLAEHGLTLDDVDVHQDLTAPLDRIRLVAVPKGTVRSSFGALDVGVQRHDGNDLAQGDR